MAYKQKLAERLRRLMKGRPGIVEKSMFGGIGFLVNGNLACGVNKDDLIVRLSEHDSEEALKHAYVRVFNMTGRPMKGWIMISSRGYTAGTTLRVWIDKAEAHARSLPPK